METNTLGLFPFFALSNVAERGLLQLLSQKLFNKDNINYKTSILYRHSAVASCQLRSAAAATLLALRAISPIRGIYPATLERARKENKPNVSFPRDSSTTLGMTVNKMLGMTESV